MGLRVSERYPRYSQADDIRCESPPAPPVCSPFIYLSVYTFGVGIPRAPCHASTGGDRTHIHPLNHCVLHNVLPIPVRGNEERAPEHSRHSSSEIASEEVLWI